ncbi:helix-turn-helix domain-containing protein [Alsobacter sp. R-9]
MSVPALDPVPHYFLYGEPLQDVEFDFLHVERIATRSRVHDWTIRPHSHPDQHQLLLLLEGGAEVRLEDIVRRVVPPALVVVPADMVHGFVFEPGSDGYVLTVSRHVVAGILGADPDMTSILEKGLCLDGDRLPDLALPSLMAGIEREFVWAARGRRTAIHARVGLLLVAVARAREAVAERDDGTVTGATARDRDLVRRLRELVEHRFREHPRLDDCALALGVTPSRLNRACRAVAGASATALLHDRIVMEAKRNLLYTGMTVSEVAISLGFDDPAYFSRFFAGRTGVPPGAFRARRRPAAATHASHAAGDETHTNRAVSFPSFMAR